MKKYTCLILLVIVSKVISAQNVVGSGVTKLNEVLPQTHWQMRVIELGPSRDFFGTITEVSFSESNLVVYKRRLQAVRGTYEHDNDPSRGVIDLFGVPYDYRLKGQTLYYIKDDKEVALLQRVAKPTAKDPSGEVSPPAYSTEDAILGWLNQNSAAPDSPSPTHPQSKKSELAQSYWQLIDYSNPIIMTNLAKELHWQPKDPIFFTFLNNGDVLLEAEVQAEGRMSIGDQRSTTIVLSYTDTGWNRVIGKDRLIRFDLKTSSGTRVLYHIVSDDGRSIYPVTIRRMGDDEPSYAYVNRTHVLSRLVTQEASE